MTLVCVRLESSFGVNRITALADARASIPRADGSFKTVSDTTKKLFSLPVRCYTLDNLAPVVGAWTDPYYETTVGLGFAGSCFEALTVVTHVAQTLCELVAPNGDRPTPTAQGLVNLVEDLCRNYFKDHSGHGKPVVHLLVFGYENGKPWIGKLKSTKEDTSSSLEWARRDTIETIGQDDLFRQRAVDLREQIEKHRRSVPATSKLQSADERSDRAREHARHDVAERKATEEEALRAIESDYVQSVGGTLQRLELSLDGGQVVAGFTQDDRAYIRDHVRTVVPGTLLGPIPIVEKMGRQMRNADKSSFFARNDIPQS